MSLLDALITNLDNGVTNRPAGNMFGAMAQLDPTRHHNFMEDFDYYLAADWVVTEVGAASQVLADVDGGALLITNAAADNDSSFQQKVGESFTIEASRKSYFRTRLAISEVIQSEFVAGLQITDTSPLAVSDGIWFQSDDADALLDIHHAIGSVVTEDLAIATLVDATFLTMEWYWDGISRFYYGVNGTPLGFLEPANAVVEELTVSFGIQNGEAVAKTMTVDYMFAAKERA